jgi:hypothetical protein
MDGGEYHRKRIPTLSPVALETLQAQRRCGALAVARYSWPRPRGEDAMTAVPKRR